MTNRPVALMMTDHKWRTNMKLTVFTVDRETGHDDGCGKEIVMIEDGSHEAHIKEAIGSACMSIINRLRFAGMDARQYDLNVRFE